MGCVSSRRVTMFYEPKPNGEKVILMQRCFWVIYIWLLVDVKDRVMEERKKAGDWFDFKYEHDFL